MTCIYLHKLCGNKPDCTNVVCRSHFPESQPMLKEDMLELCNSDEWEECARFVEGEELRAEKKRNQWKMHCPFASNAFCDKPWRWTCKASYPWLLTTYEVDEDGLPKRDEEGNIKFTYDKALVDNTCLSGDPEIYEGCPNYIAGVKEREEDMRVKKEGKQ